MENLFQTMVENLVSTERSKRSTYTKEYNEFVERLANDAQFAADFAAEFITEVTYQGHFDLRMKELLVNKMMCALGEK